MTAVTAAAADLRDQANELGEFVEWAYASTPDITTYAAIEVSEDEYEIYLDLGQAGEVTVYENVSISRDEYEVEASVDVDDLIRDNSPTSVGALRDLVEAMKETAAKLDAAGKTGGAPLPKASSSTEQTLAESIAATSQAMATALGFIEGRDNSAQRILGTALDLLGYSTGSNVLDLGYDPATVAVSPYSESGRLCDLRLGDNITGSTYGRLTAVVLDPAYSSSNQDSRQAGNPERQYVLWTTTTPEGVTNERRDRFDISLSHEPIRLDGRNREDVASVLDLTAAATDAA